MKCFFRLLKLISITVLFIVFSYSTVLAPPPEELTYEPLKFTPPEVDVRKLTNGMVLYILEDHELPLFKIYALIKTGTIYEPKEKVGLASIFADVMRTGGTQSRDPDSLNEELESLAASVEIDIGPEYAVASLSTLSEDREKGLEIFAEILMNPAFRKDKLEIRKQQELEIIRRRNDEPYDIALRYFSEILYGKGHPLGWYPEKEGVQSITVQDLKTFYQRYFYPDNTMLSVTGDFDTGALIEDLERAFHGWEKGKVLKPSVPKVKKKLEPSIYYILKDLNQSTIIMGHFGIQRSPDLPDYFALRVMNEIFGESGFTSRLYREVRDKRGLAYDVGSYMDASIYTNPGRWFVYCQTGAEKTTDTIELILDLIGEMGRQRVSEDELRLIKDSIINSFIFGFESSTQISFQEMLLNFRGFPMDYLKNFTDNIERVTSEDVLYAARKYLHPDKLIIVVVGNQKYFERPLSEIGNVKTLKLD